MAIMLDEAMSALVPKTSKTGGMPNITFEPRKPAALLIGVVRVSSRRHTR
jgi:hypothetical protein